ncbi:SCO3242 family prenyltransferase [Streptomyces sp. Ru73]|uniref:SCO3242 family prenyltransferase n=1 Tax=Streptomyces sp. Ru73 TaxID=2080748 RepID=UPI0035BC46EB
MSLGPGRGQGSTGWTPRRTPGADRAEQAGKPRREEPRHPETSDRPSGGAAHRTASPEAPSPPASPTRPASSASPRLPASSAPPLPPGPPTPSSPLASAASPPTGDPHAEAERPAPPAAAPRLLRHRGGSRGTGRARWCRARDWAELLRISAPASVPGDLLAGAAAAGLRPNTRTALATLSSLLLYEAGMALNDWADRDIDAIERPHRPIPSGRITPGAALAAAGGLTAAGLACAAAAGRPALVTATALATTVWAYDLHLKNTAAGPTAMACARTLDLLQGAVATTAPHAPTRRAARHALPSAALLGAHTLTITTVSRREAQGSSTSLPLLSLAAIATLARATTTTRTGKAAATAPATSEVPTPTSLAVTGPATPAGTAPATARATAHASPPATASTPPAAEVVARLLAAGYAVTAARPLLLAALNPSPHFLQRAVGGGIRAMIPLQGALAARAGAPATGAAVLALIPVARRLSRKVSPT